MEDFWELLDKKYHPEITYEDWLTDQMQTILTHPVGSIFSIDPFNINVKSTRTSDDKPGPRIVDMDDNNYWKLFTLLSQKNYIVMVKLKISYYLDRSTFTHKAWVDFSKFNEYLASKKYRSNYKLSLIKWMIKSPLQEQLQ